MKSNYGYNGVDLGMFGFMKWDGIEWYYIQLLDINRCECSWGSWVMGMLSIGW
jgi:hypothetical protein